MDNSSNSIYVRKIGSSWTFCDKYGACVHQDGSLAYHPEFFDEKPSGYPVYKKEDDSDEI